MHRIIWQRFRFKRGSNQFGKFYTPLNPEPDLRFGSGKVWTLNWTSGPVQESSGSNFGSGPNHGNTIPAHNPCIIQVNQWQVCVSPSWMGLNQLHHIWLERSCHMRTLILQSISFLFLTLSVIFKSSPLGPMTITTQRFKLFLRQSDTPSTPVFAWLSTSSHILSCPPFPSGKSKFYLILL